MSDATHPTEGPEQQGAARREFLERYGKLAAVTPPAIAAILSLESTPAEAAGSAIRPPRKGPKPHRPKKHKLKDVLGSKGPRDD